MSYDLIAFPLPAGMSAAEYVESEAYESEDGTPPTEEERAVMERAAAAVMALDPTAERVDAEDSIEIVSETISDISGRMDEIARPVRRPWWKIWGR